MASNTLVQPEQGDTQLHAFDAAADSYDEAFTQTGLGRWYRRMVWATMSDAFTEGDRVLELGCGTGVDAVWLARRGISVVATDASSKMLEVAVQRSATAAVDDRIEFRQIDLNRFDSGVLPNPDEQFNGIISNFGALNCVENRASLANELAKLIRPGGRLVMSVMGPMCPWEFVWHTLRLEFGTATRRFKSGHPASVGSEAMLRVWYPSIGRLEREFSPHFRTLDRAGLGLLLPPTGMARLVERFRRPFQIPAVIDRRCARMRPWLWLNDHYLLVMERRAG